MNIALIYIAVSTVLPDWVEQVPESPSDAYFVGAATSPSKEECLERGWVSALFEVGQREFPELVRISSFSREALTEVHYERVAKNYFNFIDWNGIKEARELGSPDIHFDETKHQWKCYRLLQWEKTLIENARIKARKSLEEKQSLEPLSFPLSPEQRSLIDGRLLIALRKLQTINTKINGRNEFIFEGLRRAACGITTTSLTEILGQPDRMDHCFHYWGNYYVISCHPTQPIFVFENANELKRYRLSCGQGEKL